MTDSSSDTGYDEDYTLFKNRPEWADVTPVPQDDGPNPVVAIAYSDKFRDVFDYFRAVLRSGEKSIRVLELTNHAALLNPANYTVWKYRRDVLCHLNSNLSDELNFIGETILEHPKNYQVWYHRRVIVEWMNDASMELQFTHQVLRQDSKNYHAWQHRQWVVATFKLFDEELEFLDNLLTNDVRNNSAWNQRHFVLVQTTGFTPDVIKTELEFTASKIKEVTNNESAWNYLRGVLCHTDSGNITSENFVINLCEELYKTGCRSPHLLGFMIDICEEFFELNVNNEEYPIEKALKFCDDLAMEHDKIRREYWRLLSRKIKHNIQMKGSSSAP